MTTPYHPTTAVNSRASKNKNTVKVILTYSVSKNLDDVFLSCVNPPTLARLTKKRKLNHNKFINGYGSLSKQLADEFLSCAEPPKIVRSTKKLQLERKDCQNLKKKL